ncbi:DUF5808 domain-containing protein [Pedobacter sp. MR22-3]|nr:DUF5808 domain-containing protein [Pedobacter sp. MR22-3]MCX2584325.1 DUF5808 domain-containing protein [Pedobacter sp. MR22-3]
MDDLKNYRFGVFYFNPNDSRLLVPRKLSRMAGYTLNFAKPISYFFLIIFLAIIASAIYFLSTISF